MLPPSAFDTLARLQVDYPMLFRLATDEGRSTHCGVLEFTAEEGSCYIPFWMMQNLLIEEGTVITVQNVSLPKATFVKLQPQHVDFLEISNPRAVLEHALRNYSCVTKGDVIQLPYNNKNYHFELKEVQPQDAACIIETDCNVDFDAPVGYKEPETTTSSIADSTHSSMSGLPKQSAHGDRSGCPSPTASSTSGMSAAGAEEPTGTRIVDGKIVRPDDEQAAAASGMSAAMLAERSGATGVQLNAAIPVKAPQIDYWAVNAGDGARLDGKKPAVLKDKEGQEVDIRVLRAEAAAKRAAAAAAASAAAIDPNSTGLSLSATATSPEAADADTKMETEATTTKRKSRVGSKFSRLKASSGSFHGAENKM